VDPVIEPRWLLGKPDGLDAGGDHGIQAAKRPPPNHFFELKNLGFPPKSVNQS